MTTIKGRPCGSYTRGVWNRWTQQELHQLATQMGIPVTEPCYPRAKRMKIRRMDSICADLARVSGLHPRPASQPAKAVQRPRRVHFAPGTKLNNATHASLAKNFILGGVTNPPLRQGRELSTNELQERLGNEPNSLWHAMFNHRNNAPRANANTNQELQAVNNMTPELNRLRFPGAQYRVPERYNGPA